MKLIRFRTDAVEVLWRPADDRKGDVAGAAAEDDGSRDRHIHDENAESVEGRDIFASVTSSSIES